MTRSRDYYAREKSCGCRGDSDCDCPILEESLEFPHQERIRLEIAKILAKPLGESVVVAGVDISRTQTTITRAVRGPTPSHIILDEIVDFPFPSMPKYMGG